jgi:hypothetical protein
VLVDFLASVEDEADGRSTFFLPRKGSIERLDLCFSSGGVTGTSANGATLLRASLVAWREPCELRKISESSDVFVRAREGVGRPVIVKPSECKKLRKCSQ